MAERLVYRFEGTDGPVDITGCEAVGRYFSDVFANWPHQKLAADAEMSEPVLQLAPSSEGFRLSSGCYPLEQQLHDPLNAACSIVAELAWARLRSEPDLLCFHGAAIEYNGSLVLIPSHRRAGKSTLTACLVARGRRLFTDDFLPLRLGEDGRLYGIANGSAPRLRLPLPKEFSSNVKRQIMSLAGPQNGQYLYLLPEDGQLAKHGECLPVSTIALLDRQDSTKSSISEANPVELLRRLILQNFSRQINPARILSIVGHMARQTHGLRLSYSNAEDASELLDAYLNEITQASAQKPIAPLPSLALADFQFVADQAANKQEIDAAQPYHQSSEVYELDFETDTFVASASGGGIHHLDSLARAAWGLLKAAMTVNEVTSLFGEAFPNQDKQVLHSDLSKTIRFFRNQNLIEPVVQQ